jgi:hypothetical protein
MLSLRTIQMVFDRGIDLREAHSNPFENVVNRVNVFEEQS